MATRKGRPVAEARTILVGSVTPTGSVQTYTGTTAPNGYLLCDGSTVSRTTYSALFEVLGTSHGEGDGSTTFHLPDYRGRFLRGMDNGATRDPDAATRTAANTGANTGDAIGSVQDDAIRNMTGQWTTSNRGGFTPGGTGVATTTGSNERPSGGTNNGSFDPNIIFDASRQVPTGGDNRPNNINVNYIIKV